MFADVFTRTYLDVSMNLTNFRRETMQKQTRILAASTLVMLLMAGDKSFAAKHFDDTFANCTKSVHFLADNFINRAFDSAQRCSDGRNQFQLQQTIALFPNVVEGFSGDVTVNRSNADKVIIERTYRNGEKKLEVQLGVRSFLAAVAKVASDSMHPGTTKTDIDSYTVVQRSQNEIMYFFILLGADSALTISSESMAPHDVLDFIRGFPVEDLKKSIE